jgi:hypothetical protein
MLLLKRLGTFLVLFIFLFLFLVIGSLAVGGAVAGARAGSDSQGPQTFQAGFEVGQRAGAEFARHYRGIILVGGFATATAISLAVSFSGILPWCRRKPQPPPLLG